jgi:hypothetical protein
MPSERFVNAWILDISLLWAYQHDTRSSVTNLNALNMIFHVFFETAPSSRMARPGFATLTVGDPGMMEAVRRGRLKIVRQMLWSQLL